MWWGRVTLQVNQVSTRTSSTDLIVTLISFPSKTHCTSCFFLHQSVITKGQIQRCHADMLCVCKDAFVRHQSLHECLRSQLIYSYLWHLLRTSELPPEAGCQAAMADCCGQNNRSMHCDVQIFSTAASRLTARVWLLSGTISSVAAALQLHPSYSSFLWSLKAPVQLYQHHTTTLCWHQTAQATVKCLAQPHVCKYFLTYSIHTHTHTHTYVQTLLGFHWSED